MSESTDQPGEPVDAPADAPTVQQPTAAPGATGVIPPFAGQPFAGQPIAGQLYAGQPFPGQPYPPGFGAPYPFAPVPKEPWFNPAKKTTILVTSIVLAVVLLGSGFVIGAAAVHGHDRRGVSVNGPYRGQVGAGVRPRFQLGGQGGGKGAGKLNRRGAGQLPPVPSAPSAPSGSATS